MNDREWNAIINDLTGPRFERLVRLMCEHRLERSVESHKPKAVAFSHRSSLLSKPLDTYRRRQKVINKLDAQGPDFEKDGDDARNRRSPLLSGDMKDIRHQRKILQERPLPLAAVREDLYLCLMGLRITRQTLKHRTTMNPGQNPKNRTTMTPTMTPTMNLGHLP